MAGDGGRAPDVSEQQAEGIARRFHEAYERLAPDFSYETREASAVPWDQVPESNRRLMVATVRAVLSDPAPVLAALLAESPEATVSAIEALLTSDEAVEVVARFVSQMWHHAEDVDVDDWDRQDARKLIPLVCRSLLSKAPKEDG